MQNVSQYWQLVRLNSSGQCQTQSLHPVQTWFNRTFASILNEKSDSAKVELQTQLITIWHTGSTDADLAQLSLRCYITHQIRYVCLSLAKRFGETYGFSAIDLYPLVLDDDGQPPLRYQPFTLEILTSYDPTKSQLNTWASQLTKNHPDINRALLDKGLYRTSDWAILNDTTTKQVKRILRQYHLCSEYEVGQAVDLITCYHEIYSRDRLQQRQSGQRGRCQPPTLAQLQQIHPKNPPKVVLGQLETLASQLRQYRIHARGGNPLPYQSSDPDWETLPTETKDSSNNDQQEFLAAYRQAVLAGLEHAIAQGIQANLTLLQRRRPPKDQAYLQGLHLFHCQGMSMGQLAPIIGLASTVQVTRLLQLRRLRTDVRHRLIQQLQKKVPDLAKQYVSVERLTQIDQVLEQLLTQDVDQLIDAAAREAQSPNREESKSLFANQLCQTIHLFL